VNWGRYALLAAGIIVLYVAFGFWFYYMGPGS
jgi:hypothetical protein